MSYNFDVRTQLEQTEYQKFVQLDNDTRYPATSVINWIRRDSAPPISSVNIFPKIATLTYSVNGNGGSYNMCETRTSGNPSFIPSKIFIHNSVNSDANVKLMLTSGLSCIIPIGKSSEANHVYTENLAVSGVLDYAGCSINFYA